MTATATTTPAPSKATGAPDTGQRPRRAGAAAAWPRVLAALHVQGTSLKIVFARQDGPGAPPFLMEAVTLPTTDTAQLGALLARHKPAEVVRLVPSSATVARCVAPPAGLSADRAQAAAVLALVAESELPSLIPAHRRAAGFVRPGPEASGDAVLVVGWPDRRDAAPTPLPVKDETWTPELVALAALAHALGGAELALYADRDAGSIALVASARPHAAGTMNGTAGNGAGKTVARVLRADTSSDDAWRTSLQNAVAETAVSLSIPVATLEIPAGPATLIVLGSPLRRPRGMPAEPAWLSSYGPAFGAICALTDADPAARPLALLRASAPRETAGAVVRAVEWLTAPRHAVLAAVVCLALFLLWPLAVAKSREWILSSSAGGSVELDKRLREAERRVAFYKQLREKRWPMAKLIADIAGAAPEGLSIDLLTLQREQGGINVRGRAETAEHVTRFRRYLAASGVFGFLTTPTVESTGDGVVFQLEAQVVSPQFRAPLRAVLTAEGKVEHDPDFVAKSLGERMYGPSFRKGGAGDGADTTASDSHPASSSPRAGTSTPRDTPRDRPRNAGGNNRNGSLRGDSGSREDTGTSSRRSASEKGVPEPVSDADIAKMDANTAMKEFTSRKVAAGKVEDQATKQRLLDEAEKCKTRMQEARKGS